MNNAKVIQVIVTESNRGLGRDSSDPVRIVTQYWSLDGQLLAEVDSISQYGGTEGNHVPTR